MGKRHPGKEIIEVVGVRNFRGLGGVKVGDKTFKYGLAFRCANLSKITAEGVKTLQKLNIRYDFDFRTNREKTEKPDPAIEGITILEFDILGAPTAGLSHEQYMTPKEFLSQAMPMDDLYVTMLSKCTDRYADAFQKSVRCLLNNEPFLFHCSEGKDRTGIFAMLILELLGASEEVILEDYLITNEIAKRRARRRALLSVAFGLRNANRAFAYSVAKPAYMKAAFEYIRTFGGFVPFAKSQLGVTDEQIEALKKACLE